jgi:glycosyltransferase involved in cell wall biosynthesis
MKQSLENLNIAIVHDWLTNVAGGERVVLAIHELFPKAPIYTSIYDSASASAFKDMDIRPSFLQRFKFLRAKREFLTPFTPFAFEQFDLSKYDLVISSSSMAAKGVVTKPTTTHICYCHTPARYLWEPQVDPRASSGLFSGLRKHIAHKMRIWDRLAADRVDHFIANSRYIQNRITKYYQRESKLVYPPVDVERFTIAKNEEVKDYFLFVSRLVDYKRADIVIDAFNQLGLPLKVIGRGPEKISLQKSAKENIEFLGYLEDKEVARYYREAKAFVFAAEEDFGIVPVEAMAAGRPVIAYGQGGVAEIVDENCGILFDKQTAASLKKAVQSFEYTNFDSQKIRERAELFSKQRFLDEVSHYINELINKD